jgi:MFS family permease
LNTPADAPYPNPKYAWYVVIVLFFAYTSSFVDRIIMSLLVEPIKRDLVLTDTQFSLLHGFAFAIFYTLMGLPLGRLADRANRRWIISIGVLLWSLMTAVCGLTKTFTTLFLARIGVGVGEAALSPSAYTKISDYFPQEKRGVPISLY